MYNQFQPNAGLARSLSSNGLSQVQYGAQPAAGGLQAGAVFDQMFSQQMQAASGMTININMASITITPGQFASAAGHGLPSVAAEQPLIMETFSYSRISMMPGEGEASPMEGLAAMLKALLGGETEELEHGEGKEELAEIGAKGTEIVEEMAVMPKALPAAEQAVAAEESKVTETALAASEAAGLGLAEIGGKISEKVIDLAQKGVPEAQAAIDHPELGRIEARVEIDGSNVTLAFGAENAAVRDALEAAQAEIEGILGESGLVLAAMDISETLGPAATPDTLEMEAGEQLARSTQLDQILNESLGGGPLNLIQA